MRREEEEVEEEREEGGGGERERGEAEREGGREEEGVEIVEGTAWVALEKVGKARDERAGSGGTPGEGEREGGNAPSTPLSVLTSLGTALDSRLLVDCRFSPPSRTGAPPSAVLDEIPFPPLPFVAPPRLAQVHGFNQGLPIAPLCALRASSRRFSHSALYRS